MAHIVCPARDTVGWLDVTSTCKRSIKRVGNHLAPGRVARAAAGEPYLVNAEADAGKGVEAAEKLTELRLSRIGRFEPCTHFDTSMKERT